MSPHVIPEERDENTVGVRVSPWRAYLRAMRGTNTTAVTGEPVNRFDFTTGECPTPVTPPSAADLLGRPTVMVGEYVWWRATERLWNGEPLEGDAAHCRIEYPKEP